jgi:hypothetical protein
VLLEVCQVAVVQAVLDNHCAALRAHWTRHQRVWPEEL